MRRNRRFVLLVALVLGAGCAPEPRDLEAIERDGTLVALLPYNSTTYFLYRGEPMGYEFELLRAFAQARDLALRVSVVGDRTQLFGRLRARKGDVAAGRMLPHLERPSGVVFTRPVYETPLAVVQGDAAIEIEARPVEEPEDLAGRSVHLPAGSRIAGRLVELSEELSGDIEVVEVGGGVSAETLIRRVARGEIELTVSLRNLALLKKGYFRQIEVRPTLGPPRGVAWAVHEGAPVLRAALDAWIGDPAQQPLLRELHFKYFVDRRGYRERVLSEYLTSETGVLSPYDALFRREADALGWDWRLLASMAFQESRFRPRARSWAGALGLMQIMPATAAELEIEDPLDPGQNVAGAVRYLAWLEGYWRDAVPDEDARARFVLASYNIGIGHVKDARALAEKHGDDPTHWPDVAAWLLQKSKKPVYTDPVVEHGFCRGLEPVTYVRRVLERYAHYRQFVPETATSPDEDEAVRAGPGPAGLAARGLHPQARSDTLGRSLRPTRIR